MKSLILKDLYNLRHSSKSLPVTLIVLAALLLTSSNASMFVFICATLFGTMLITPFAFDENDQWTRYALVMPISRREVVAARYAVHLILAFSGALTGALVGLIGLTPMETLQTAAAALGATLLSGSTLIPLLIRFGAEKGRLLLIPAYLVPAALLGGIYLLAQTVAPLPALLMGMAALTALWEYAMYRMSCALFARQD